MLPAEDETVVAQIRRGESDAMRQLVLLHFEGMARYAESIVGARDDAEDVAQDVLTCVWEGHDTWTPRTSIRAYLLTAVRSRAIDLRRQLEARRRRAERAAVAQEGDSPTPDASLLWAEEDAVLRRAFQTLPERWREVVALRYGQQLPFQDVGRVLGISEDAAKKLARRAVLELRRILGV